MSSNRLARAFGVRKGMTPRVAALWALAAISWLVVPVAALWGVDSNPGRLIHLGSAVLAVLFVTLAVLSVPRERRRPWLYLLAMAWIELGGDFCLSALQLSGHTAWPTPADVFYIAGYLVYAVGVLALDRQRHRRPGLGRLLDAGILAVGCAVLLAVFVALPSAADTDQSMAARILGAVYPLIDVVVVFLLARVLLDNGRSAAIGWVAASMLCTLSADISQDLLILNTEYLTTPRWMLVAWQWFYVFVGFGALCARTGPVSAPTASEEERLTGPRLAVLALAATIPAGLLMALVLTGDDHSIDPVDALSIATASTLLVGLVSARMFNLLGVLRRQAEQLAMVARTDPLTQVANRRSWDFELDRRIAVASEQESVLLVALLDLDHFKQFNDSRGHQEGDVLLRQAAAAWSAALSPAGTLARWGGEEFAAALHCTHVPAGVAALDALRSLVPSGQTCSIGIAQWDGVESPHDLANRADSALYEAKHGGRNRSVLAAGPDQPTGTLPVHPRSAAESAQAVAENRP